MRYRVGNGFDVHRFSDDPDTAPASLGRSGVRRCPRARRPLRRRRRVPRVADALLGAAGSATSAATSPTRIRPGPAPTASTCSPRSSRWWRPRGGGVANVDCSVIAERPKLAPHRRAMEVQLSSVAGGPVTVKGRRAERLGAIGRSEGVVCLASALLEAD